MRLRTLCKSASVRAHSESRRSSPSPVAKHSAIAAPIPRDAPVIRTCIVLQTRSDRKIKSKIIQRKRMWPVLNEAEIFTDPKPCKTQRGLEADLRAKSMEQRFPLDGFRLRPGPAKIVTERHECREVESVRDRDLIGQASGHHLLATILILIESV